MATRNIKNVLFLCTGNSCRSQLAEAIVNHDLAGQWHAFSAGTEPAGYVHPKAVQVLQDLGISHQGRSKSVEEFHGATLDLVVTVCDSAAETCPVWLGREHKVHIGFPDPASAQGTDEEILAVFRSVRDDIRKQIVTYLREYVP